MHILPTIWNAKNTDCIGRFKLLWMVALGWGMLTWKHKSQKQSCSPDIDRSADSEFGVIPGVTLVEKVVLAYFWFFSETKFYRMFKFLHAVLFLSSLPLTKATRRWKSFWARECFWQFGSVSLSLSRICITVPTNSSSTWWPMPADQWEFKPLLLRE